VKRVRDSTRGIQLGRAGGSTAPRLRLAHDEPARGSPPAPAGATLSAVSPPEQRPGPRRPGRDDAGAPVGQVGQHPGNGGDAAEQRRLAATVRQLRIELARLRGELDDDAEAPAPAAAGTGAKTPAVELERRLADAQTRAAEAESRLVRVTGEMTADRQTLDLLRALLAAEQDAGRERDRLLADTRASAEARVEEQALAHDREVEQLRTDLAAARHQAADLAARLAAEASARARLEVRTRQLDAEIDELRAWISAAQSRRRGVLRRDIPPRRPRADASDPGMRPPGGG
jgi:hypothetical protein